LITGNTFTYCQSEYGAALGIMSQAHATAEDNTFDSNTSSNWGGAICVRDTSTATVSGNRLYHNSATGSGGAIVCQNECEADIDGNIFWDNEADYGGALSVSMVSVARCSDNTFYDNAAPLAGASIQSYTGSRVRMWRCIVAASSGAAALQCSDWGTAPIDCNNFWDNDSDYDGCSPGPNDFYTDPMLCDPDHGNFYIDCISPCNGFAGCGLVGALGVGCGATATRTTTWGAVKALYR
jgi:predicted outer membrane repeat protein